MSRVRLPFLLPCFLGAFLASSAAAQHPSLARQFSFALMDFGLLADTSYGASLVAAPGVRSEQGQHSSFIWLRFNPDSLIPWLDVAGVYLNQPPSDEEPEGIRWAPMLATIRHHGGLSFGRKVHHRQWLNERYVKMADSANTWILEITSDESRTLLNGLLEIGSLSHYTPGDADTTRARMSGELDTPPSVRAQEQPHWMGTSGRVIIQVEIDTTGVADINTFLAVICSDTVLEGEAKRVMAKSRYHPGLKDGRPVRTLVQQTISWLYPP